MDDMQIVLVRWLDAVRHDEAEVDDVLAPIEARTVGWLVQDVEGAAYIVVAAERFEAKDTVVEFRDVTTIPRGLVLSMVTLEPADALLALEVTFDHTPPEAPYSEDGTPCRCDVCRKFDGTADQVLDLEDAAADPVLTQ